jgi:hypothetical protein
MKRVFAVLGLLAIVGGIILFRLAIGVSSEGQGMFYSILATFAFIFAGIMLLGAIIVGWK